MFVCKFISALIAQNLIVAAEIGEGGVCKLTIQTLVVIVLHSKPAYLALCGEQLLLHVPLGLLLLLQLLLQAVLLILQLPQTAGEGQLLTGLLLEKLLQVGEKDRLSFVHKNHHSAKHLRTIGKYDQDVTVFVDVVGLRYMSISEIYIFYFKL